MAWTMAIAACLEDNKAQPESTVSLSLASKFLDHYKATAAIHEAAVNASGTQPKLDRTRPILRLQVSVYSAQLGTRLASTTCKLCICLLQASKEINPTNHLHIFHPATAG